MHIMPLARPLSIKSLIFDKSLGFSLPWSANTVNSAHEQRYCIYYDNHGTPEEGQAALVAKGHISMLAAEWTVPLRV